MNDKIAAMVAAAARLPAAERRELIDAIADTLANEACEPLSRPTPRDWLSPV
jgi:hypothetical protein